MGFYSAPHVAIKYPMCAYAGFVETVREEMVRELDRISIRLASLNLERLAAMADLVYECATGIWNSSDEGARELPRVGPTAYCAQITVLTQDLLAQSPDGNPEAAAALTALRRALP